MNIQLIILIAILFTCLRTFMFIMNSLDNNIKKTKDNIPKVENNEIKSQEIKRNNNEIKKNNNEIKSIEHKNSIIPKNNEKGQLILYSASWCGICNKIKPNWMKAKEKINKMYPNVEVLNIDCTKNNNNCYTLNKEKKEKLDGVPTIVYRKNNNDIEYKRNDSFIGDRSENELVRFCSINI